MIPSDLAARLRMLSEASFFNNESPVQGLARVKEVQARLSELFPGQRFEATLQRSLPDGTFQAIVAGRTYTLALNHPAKAGDTLELVVTKTDGKTVFAQPANTPSGPAVASNTALSSTGRLISFLLTGQPTPQPAALAGGKPLMATAPQVGNGAQFAPILRQALTQSGLFYESHQAKWLSGKVDLNNLKLEPQGQQNTAATARSASTAMNQMAGLLSGQASAALREGLMQTLNRVTGVTGPAGEAAEAADETANTGNRPANATATGTPSSPATSGKAATAASSNTAQGLTSQQQAADEGGGRRVAESTQQQQSSQALRTSSVPERLIPIVHQQLDALGTQTYVWHGQAWPGQELEWEIEDPEGGEQGGDGHSEEWNTTLRLTMPQLGGIEARLHLTPAGVALRLLADDADAVAALEAASAQLDSALSAHDLPLMGFVAERRDAAG